MATRGSYGFKYNEELKVTYNHFDSYLTDLGCDTMMYVLNHTIDEMKADATKLQLVNECDTPTPAHIKLCEEAGTIKLGVSPSEDDPMTRYPIEGYYYLLREAQRNLGALCRVGLMTDGCEFFTDDLYCAYSYVINLDTGMFEYYKMTKLRGLIPLHTIHASSPEMIKHFCEAPGVFNIGPAKA